LKTSTREGEQGRPLQEREARINLYKRGKHGKTSTREVATVG